MINLATLVEHSSQKTIRQGGFIFLALNCVALALAQRHREGTRVRKQPGLSTQYFLDSSTF